MAGAVDKKKNDIKEQLEAAPKTFVDARSSILADITLSREFAANFLDALCAPLAGKNESGVAANMSLNTVCRTLEKQRRLCYGAKAISTDFTRAFDLPDHSVINGSLGLTEPSTSTFGIKATDIGETYPITLSNVNGTTQTQDSNTFSVYVGDYYLVRSRVSGELIDIADDVDPYSKPDGETVFGNAVVWVSGTGGDVATELEANTWNYNWATANIASVATTGSGATELNTLTLSSALTPGSNSANYTPLGPAFAQKFYLKRKVDFVETFTITGTTSINSVSITGVSEADLAKVKHGDVISGTGIPDAIVTIQAVQTEKSAIRLTESGTATADGTVTLTVNSVPFGYQAHDIFCQVEIVAEGLVVNDNWKPVGDDDGVYSAANEGEDELLVATTTEFKNLLQFFNPSSPNNDLTRGASASLVSDGKEYNGTNYPDIETNVFFPANLGTTAEKATKQGEFTGTQPEGLGNKDVWVGRYVAWNKDRMNADADKVGEYRYVLDNAERFFYAPSRNDSYSGGNSLTVLADPDHPATRLAETPPVTNEKEPRPVLPRATLSPITAAITTTSSVAIPAIGAIGGITANKGPTSIPADDNTSVYHGSNNTGGYRVSGSTYWSNDPTTPKVYSWISGQSPPTQTTATQYGQHVARSFYTVSGNYVIRNEIYYDAVTVTGGPPASGSWTATVAVRQAVADVTHNFYGGFLIYDPDVVFLTSTVTDLKNSVRFRDPNITETTKVAPREIPAGTGSPFQGISDLDFENYIRTTVDGNGDTAWEATITAMNTRLGEVRTALQNQINAGRTGNNNGGNNLGTAIVVTSPNMTTAFATFTSENATLLSNCNKRVAEVDARIGLPLYAGAPQSTKGNPPTIHVEKIPSSNTTSGLLPYGRSIYNNVNYLLGQDIELLGKITKDIESLTDLIDLVKSDRNKYEIFSGRDKVY